MARDHIRCLHIEDDVTTAYLTQLSVEHAAPSSVRITHAPTLDAGVCALASAPFDVVLLDLGLPDSLDAAQALLRVCGASTTPVVIVSSSPEAVADERFCGCLAASFAKTDVLPRMDADADGDAWDGPRTLWRAVIDAADRGAKRAA